MINLCGKCRFECDSADAFCRRCGAALAQEGNFTELVSEDTGNIVPAQVVEVVTPTLDQSQALAALAPASRPTQLVALSRKVGSKVGQALHSEAGRKLTRGAATLAVAVGVELASQAVKQLTRTTPPGQGRVPARPMAPATIGEALLKAMEDQLAAPGQGQPATEVEEIYYRERVYIRRTIRRPR